MDTEHCSDRDAITQRSSVSAAVIWDTHRPGAQNQILRSRSGRMVGTHSLMVHDSALMDQHRETAYRPGPHPHRSARQFIHLDLTSSSSSASINTSGSFNLPTVNHSAAGNSVQFVDQDITTSTGASLVCTTDSFGNRTLVLGGMDWRSLGGIPGRFGIVGDSCVQLFLSDTGPCWSSSGSIGTYCENTTQRKRD